MDLFTFDKTFSDFILKSGRLVNSYDTLTWTEKFRDASEFVVTGAIDSNLREELPIGNLVSHVDTEEVMIVENHSIVAGKNKNEIKVSGRSFETFLENRIVGSNRTWPEIAFPQSQYVMDTNLYGYTVRRMLANHMDWQELVDDNDQVPNINLYLSPWISTLFGNLAPAEEDEFPREELYQQVIKLLEVDNLGINTVRPTGRDLDDSRDVPTRYGSQNLTIQIYPGFDRSRKVVFSHQAGDIEAAEYLWSNKTLKTSCLVKSKYFVVMVHGPEVRYSRRVMILDASDLDESYETIPGTGTGARIRAIMARRGRAAIARRNSVAISSVKLNPEGQSYKYRKDYNLGDIVAVHGDYHAATIQQVTEHVEIEDVNGYSSYPTLSDLPPGGGYYVSSQFFS